MTVNKTEYVVIAYPLREVSWKEELGVVRYVGDKESCHDYYENMDKRLLAEACVPPNWKNWKQGDKVTLWEGLCGPD